VVVCTLSVQILSLFTVYLYTFLISLFCICRWVP